MFGPLGIAIAAVILLFGGLALAASGLTRWFRTQSDELEEFSGAIAGARAVIEGQRVQNRLERSQAIGPQVASATAARGRLEDAVYDVTTELAKTLADMAPILETGIDILTAMARATETGINYLQAIAAAATLQPGKAFRELAEADESAQKMAEAIVNIFGPNDVDNDSIIQGILNHNPLAPLASPNANPNLPGAP